MNWYRLDLGDALLAQPRLDEIGQQGREAFEAAGRPAGWAVGLVHVSGKLHCRAELYFSPAAGGLARALGALPCAKPEQGLSVLAGRMPATPPASN